MVLPTGFELPALPYLVAIVLATLAVATMLAVLQPKLGTPMVLALAPWMVVGSIWHVLYVVGAFDAIAVIEPFFSQPAVYATTFVVLGSLWLGAGLAEEAGLIASTSRLVGVVGATLTVVFLVFALYIGVRSNTLAPLWPVLAFIFAGVTAAITLIGFSLIWTDAMAQTGRTGILVVFAHALDGVTTAIGVDVLGAGEQSPVPQAIMNLAGQIRTAAGVSPELLGVGWLFVAVKLVLAILILYLFADYHREHPYRANLALAIVAAVGLGPGSYNLVLFAIGG